MRRAVIAALVVVLVAGAAFAGRHVLRAREDARWFARARAVVEERFPAWEVANPEPPVLQLSHRGAAVTIRLDNLRRNADDDPGRFAAQVLNAAESAAHVIDAERSGSGTTLDYAAVRETLHPVLVSLEYAHAQNLTMVRFVGDVFEAFVVDGAHHQRYVRDPDVVRWGVRADAMHADAAAALRRRAAGETYEKLTPEEPAATGAYLVIDTTDGYAAARLVLPEVRERIGKALGYPFFVGIPSRDLLVAWSNGFTFAARFAAQVREDFARRSYPISPEVFRVDEQGGTSVLSGLPRESP